MTAWTWIWRRPRVAIGIIVIGGLALILVVALGDGDKDSRVAQPRVAGTRVADIHGRIVGSLARFEDLVGTQVDGHNLIGPARVSIGGRQIVVPRGTPLYGASGGCGAITGDPRTPCFGQAGLRPDGRTARWILVFSTSVPVGPAPANGSVTRWKGEIRSVSGDNIVFKDGAVVPGATAVVDCFVPRPVLRAYEITLVPNYQALLWDATIDHATGRAVRLQCAGRA